MERKLFNIVRPREGKDGKTFWDRHGILIVKDGKISVHINSIPTGEWDGWLQVYPREEQEQQAGQPQVNNRARRPTGGNGQAFQAPPPAQDFDDDIPF